MSLKKISKCLKVLFFVESVWGRGYFTEVNLTRFEWQPEARSFDAEKEIRSYLYEAAVPDYATSARKREPKFVGFAIQDDNIKIEMQMAVPFLSVPTKKNVGKKTKLVNVNVASLLVASFFTIFGTFLGGATRFFRGDFVSPKKKINSSHPRRQKRDLTFEIFNKIDEALLQIDFDVLACLQRSICWHVNESLMNVQDNRAGKLDKLISGFINADWSHRVISNAMIVDAIETGKKGKNCETKYHKCPLSSQKLEGFAEKIKKYAKRKN